MRDMPSEKQLSTLAKVFVRGLLIVKRIWQEGSESNEGVMVGEVTGFLRTAAQVLTEVDDD